MKTPKPIRQPRKNLLAASEAIAKIAANKEMNKRDVVAMHALQGILSNDSSIGYGPAAVEAVKYADALLRELSGEV